LATITRKEPMEQAVRLIVAGGRYISDANLVFDTIRGSQMIPELIISGGCSGVDKFGEMFAKEHNIEIVRFLADWNKHGKAAGPIRNRQMAKFASENNNGALILVWDGSSRGSKNMLENAMKYKLKIFQRIVTP